MSDEVSLLPLVLRGSGLGMLFLCPPSKLDTKIIRIRKVFPQATLGKAIHVMLGDYVVAGEYDAKAVGARHGLSDEQQIEAETLAYQGARIWDKLKSHFELPQAEAKVAGDVLKVGDRAFQVAGTLDVVGGGGEHRAILLDWKSGYVDSGFAEQIGGYAYALWCTLGRPENFEVLGVIALLRRRVYRVLKFSSADLRAFEHDLVHNVLPNARSFATGGHCVNCDLYHDCPARKAVSESTMKAMLSGSTGGSAEDAERLYVWQDRLANLTEETKDEGGAGEFIRQLSGRLKLAKKAVASMDELLRACVKRVGDIDLGNGEVLRLAEVQRKKLDPMLAWPILQGRMSTNERLSATTLSIPKMLDAYAKRFARGEKGQAKKALMETLDAAGAVQLDTSLRLEVADKTLLEDKEDGTGD